MHPLIDSFEASLREYRLRFLYFDNETHTISRHGLINYILLPIGDKAPSHTRGTKAYEVANDLELFAGVGKDAVQKEDEHISQHSESKHVKEEKSTFLLEVDAFPD